MEQNQNVALWYCKDNFSSRRVGEETTDFFLCLRMADMRMAEMSNFSPMVGDVAP